MLRLTHEHLDVERMRELYLDKGGAADKFEAAGRIQRSPSEIWMVAKSPVDLGDDNRPPNPTTWAHTKREGLVDVPLIPYLTSADHGTAWGFAVQVGVKIALELDKKVSRLHLVVGNPVLEEDHPTFGTVWRFWLGIAVLLGR